MKYLVYSMIVALVTVAGCKKKSATTNTPSKKKQSKAAADDATDSFHPKVTKIVAGSLVDASGGSVDTTRITSKKYLLIYYAADWNSDSKDFTPSLVKWYNKDNTDYEVVFVSSDRTEEKMLSHMKETKMPWLAVKHQSKAHPTMLKFRKGGTLPCLVLLDQNDKRLAGSYDEAGTKYLGPENAYDVLEELIEKAEVERAAKILEEAVKQAQEKRAKKEKDTNK